MGEEEWEVALTFEPQTLSISEAALIMGVSRDVAYDLARTGQFPTPILRIGRRWRVPREPFERYVQSQGPEPEVAEPPDLDSTLRRVAGKLSGLNKRQLLAVEKIVDELSS